MLDTRSAVPPFVMPRVLDCVHRRPHPGLNGSGDQAFDLVTLPHPG